MKSLHRSELFCWSTFERDKNIDFNSVLWVRPEGNVMIDPVTMTDHDRAHVDQLGGAKLIVLTNSDHVRESAQLAKELGAVMRCALTHAPVPHVGDIDCG